MKPLTVAIAGAGPAGLSAALMLHRDGHRVKLFDQFDTPKPLGSLSLGFTPFYQSDSRLLPPLRDFVIAPATRLPLARWLVAASVAGLVLAG